MTKILTEPPGNTSGAILISLGGDHGIPIPVMRALEIFDEPITLVHVDAHLDWRDEINGETEGYSSPIRRASEMPWIKEIVQIGLRGIGSARAAAVEDARLRSRSHFSLRNA